MALRRYMKSKTPSVLEICQKQWTLHLSQCSTTTGGSDDGISESGLQLLE
jgi:hypothetical protein